ncbi:MAG: tyrosine-type recombinase/integrase [Legionellales bacterium]|nr:tyrosine-type recombinase/integrase [Legionellales bacterium]
MGHKKLPGLYKRGSTWHVDKRVFGHRLCESTGTSILKEAESYVMKRIEDLRKILVYGERPKYSFREAATKYLLEHQDKASIVNDAIYLKAIDPYIGDLLIENVHMATLQPYVEARKQENVKNRTINYALELVRHILNLAASEWMDNNGRTWLKVAPKIRLLRRDDARKPFPLNWDEQRKLFQELPTHLHQMALFAVNTGCRSAEICALRWEWEVKIPELNTSVFIIPREHVKNREERLVVLNRIATNVIDAVRGQHPSHVFTFRNQPITGKMNNTAWKNACRRAGVHVRVHDLKHTFGRRLRAAGVSFEDRQDLLGHKSGRITTHYSEAELTNLIEAANKVCDTKDSIPVFTLLRRVA